MVAVAADIHVGVSINMKSWLVLLIVVVLGAFIFKFMLGVSFQLLWNSTKNKKYDEVYDGVEAQKKFNNILGFAVHDMPSCKIDHIQKYIDAKNLLLSISWYKFEVSESCFQEMTNYLNDKKSQRGREIIQKTSSGAPLWWNVQYVSDLLFFEHVFMNEWIMDPKTLTVYAHNVNN